MGCNCGLLFSKYLFLLTRYSFPFYSLFAHIGIYLKFSHFKARMFSEVFKMLIIWILFLFKISSFKLFLSCIDSKHLLIGWSFRQAIYLQNCSLCSIAHPLFLTSADFYSWAAFYFISSVFRFSQTCKNSIQSVIRIFIFIFNLFYVVFRLWMTFFILR